MAKHRLHQMPLTGGDKTGVKGSKSFSLLCPRILEEIGCRDRMEPYLTTTRVEVWYEFFTLEFGRNHLVKQKLIVVCLAWVEFLLLALCIIALVQ